MTTAAKIVSASLPYLSNQTAVDATSTGFGTPSACIIITSATTDNDTETARGQHCIAFFDGTRTVSSSVFIEDNVGTTNCSRSTQLSFLLVGASENTDAIWTLQFITDGVRIQWSSGTLDVSRTATVILLKTKSAYCSANGLGNTTNNVSVTAPGFRPTIIFTAVATSIDAKSTHLMLSFGAAHINSSGAITQLCDYFSAVDAATTERNNSGTFQNAGVSYRADGSINTLVSITGVLSNGFRHQTSVGSGAALMYCALELDSHDDAYVGVIDSPTTTGSQSVAGLPFRPELVMFGSTGATALNTHSTAPPQAHMVGASDGSAQHTHMYSATEQTTLRSWRRRSVTNAIELRGVLRAADGGALTGAATVSSLNSDGWTLNWTTANATSRKVTAFAIGNSAAVTAPTLGTASVIDITATGATPRLTATW